MDATGAPRADRSPLVSVVMATYNRSNVLALAIESVLRQTIADLELLVIGDACTDDSEAVVRSFGDPRIRWTNLAVNTGDQSGPNNEGGRQARGRFVAYLNHDDLWFPDHLERCVAHLEATGADLVFALAAVHARSGRRVAGATPTGRYDLLAPVPASMWVLRHELLSVVGPWRPPTASRVEPSQDWLLRAHRRGLDLRSVPALTVVIVSSTAVAGAYRERHVDAQAVTARAMAEDPTRLRADLAVALLALQAVELAPRSLGANTRVLLRDLLHRTSARFGVHPHATSAVLRGRGRGGWKRRVDEIRGLDRDSGAAA